MAEHTYTEHEAAALRRERAAYIAQGKTDRAKAVEDQLKRDGWPVADPSEKPAGRTRRGGETGDDAEGAA